MEKQQIKARFFGMHIGCEFKHTCLSGTTENMGVYNELDEDSAKTNYRVRDVFNKWYSLELAQLILKPLSSITDEDAIECAKLTLGQHGKYEVYNNGFGQRVVRKDESFLHCLCISHENMTPMQYDNLRSKGYYLPFMSLDPIAENWAILEETK